MLIDLTNQRFGRWIVVSKATSKHNNTMWNCKCDCGNFKEVASSSLLNGRSNSCGCLQKELITTHGMRNTPTYNSWDNMMARCYRESNPCYKEYGGRGIAVDKRWHNFQNFIEDMGKRPESTTIDRKDPNKNYSLDNCRWVTNNVQQLNKRNNNIVTYNGQQIPITKAARLAGLKPETVISRQRAGKTGDELFIPVKKE